MGAPFCGGIGLAGPEQSDAGDHYPRKRQEVGKEPDQVDGSLFFAAAPVFEAALPEITQSSRHSVVILRLRGRSDFGSTFMDVLNRYAKALAAVDSKLVIVSANQRVQDQLRVAGITATIGQENVYATDERVGATLKRAHADAVTWIEDQPRDGTQHVEKPS